MGAGGRRNSPNSPLSLGLLLPVSWRRRRSQRHSILSLIPDGAQNALVSGARRTSSEQEGVLRLGRRERPCPARAGGLKPSSFLPSIVRQRTMQESCFGGFQSSDLISGKSSRIAHLPPRRRAGHPYSSPSPVSSPSAGRMGLCTLFEAQAGGVGKGVGLSVD